jgi:DNA (cytosine-5)-methyltransferase 1
MKYIDLFAGAGGFSLGLKAAGFQLVYANEFDSHAANTFRKNLSIFDDKNEKMIEGPIEELHDLLNIEKVKVEISEKNLHNNQVNEVYYDKAKKIDVELVKGIENVKEVDFIIGGPPCQGFSNAGRGKKPATLRNFSDYIDDPRNHLFKYFLGFVARYNPKVVIIENVKGLTTAGNYRSLIEDSLENTGKGYNTLSKVLLASSFGVPQIRERIFFIGVRKDVEESDEFIFWLNNILTYHQETEVSTKEAIQDLPQIRSNPFKLNTKRENEIPIGVEDSFGEDVSTKKFKNLVTAKSKYRNTINTVRGVLKEPPLLYNHKTRYNNEDDLKIYTLMKPGLYINHPDNYEALKLCKYGTKKVGNKVTISGFADKYFKLHPDKPSRTIVAHLKNDNNGYIHYGSIPRGISVREAARLQSFPDWYRFYGPIGFQFKQIGNAVPPLLAKKLGQLLMSFIENGVQETLDKYHAGELFK